MGRILNIMMRERALTSNRGITAHLSIISVVSSCWGCWEPSADVLLARIVSAAAVSVVRPYLPTTRPAVVTVLGLRCLLCDESSSPTASVVSQRTQDCRHSNTKPPPVFVTSRAHFFYQQLQCGAGCGGNY